MRPRRRVASTSPDVGKRRHSFGCCQTICIECRRSTMTASPASTARQVAKHMTHARSPRCGRDITGCALCAPLLFLCREAPAATTLNGWHVLRSIWCRCQIRMSTTLSAVTSGKVGARFVSFQLGTSPSRTASVQRATLFRCMFHQVNLPLPLALFRVENATTPRVHAYLYRIVGTGVLESRTLRSCLGWRKEEGYETPYKRTCIHRVGLRYVATTGGANWCAAPAPGSPPIFCGAEFGGARVQHTLARSPR